MYIHTRTHARTPPPHTHTHTHYSKIGQSFATNALKYLMDQLEEFYKLTIKMTKNATSKRLQHRVDRTQSLNINI